MGRVPGRRWSGSAARSRERGRPPLRSPTLAQPSLGCRRRAPDDVTLTGRWRAVRRCGATAPAVVGTVAACPMHRWSGRRRRRDRGQRSGTTLLRLMLDAHPDLAVPEETHFLGGLVDRPAGDLSVDQVVDVMVASPAWPNLHVEVDDLRLAVADCEPSRSATRCAAFYRLSAARQGKRRWVTRRRRTASASRASPGCCPRRTWSTSVPVTVGTWRCPCVTSGSARVPIPWRRRRHGAAQVHGAHEARGAGRPLPRGPLRAARHRPRTRAARPLPLPRPPVTAPAMLVHHRTADERLADIRVPPSAAGSGARRPRPLPRAPRARPPPARPQPHRPLAHRDGAGRRRRLRGGGRPPAHRARLRHGGDPHVRTLAPGDAVARAEEPCGPTDHPQPDRQLPATAASRRCWR